MSLTFASLFSGIGGFDLGLERAGMECVLQVENNRAARSVLERHWPDVRRIARVEDVTTADVCGADLICGGFPCQDLSHAGRRAGLAGKRSRLWFEFYRLIEGARPPWVVIENVPGLLSSNEGRDFAFILDGLVECGYCVAWRVLDAQYLGLAQRRKRIFIVASLGNGRCAEIFSEPEGGQGRAAQSEGTRADVAATIGASAPSRRNGGSAPAAGHLIAFDRTTSEWQEDRTGTLRVSAGASEGVNDAKADHWCVAALTANGVGTVGADDNQAQAGHLIVVGGNNPNELDVTTTLSSHGSGRYDFDSDTFVIASQPTSSALKAEGADASEDGRGRHAFAIAFTERSRNGERALETSEVAYALTSADGGNPHSRRILSYAGVRRLTPRECERLQGFPDDWTAGQKDSPRYKQLGNAVAVPVAEWIGRRIMESLTSTAPCA